MSKSYSKRATALFAASGSSSKKIIKILVQGGADVNLQDKSRETALFRASQYSYTKIVEIPVQGGADVKPANNLQLLLLGPEPDVGTDRGVYDNALSYACSFGLQEFVKLLLNEGARFRVPVATYDKALGHIGSRTYLLPHKYETIAMQLSRAIAALLN